KELQSSFEICQVSSACQGKDTLQIARRTGARKLDAEAVGRTDREKRSIVPSRHNECGGGHSKNTPPIARAYHDYIIRNPILNLIYIKLLRDNDKWLNSVFIACCNRYPVLDHHTLSKKIGEIQSACRHTP